MKRFWRWLKSVNAFRIGLFTGLLFSALQVLQIAGRAEVPLLTKMEKALVDLRFKQRVDLKPMQASGRIVIAAVDEAAIARFGRFPWDRRGGAPPPRHLNHPRLNTHPFATNSPARRRRPELPPP